jgi:hypothetical protein
MVDCNGANGKVYVMFFRVVWSALVG